MSFNKLPLLKQLLEQYFLSLNGKRPMKGTLRLETTIGDALRIGSPTKTGRPVVVYADDVGNKCFLFKPDTVELYLIDKSTNPEAWDKALIWFWAGNEQSFFGLYSSPELSHTTFSEWNASDQVVTMTIGFDYHSRMRFYGREETATLWLTTPNREIRIGYDSLTTPQMQGLILNGLGLYIGVGRIQSLPSPSAEYRGRMIRVEGAGGVADKLYICEWNGSTYAWRQI